MTMVPSQNHLTTKPQQQIGNIIISPYGRNYYCQLEHQHQQHYCSADIAVSMSDDQKQAASTNNNHNHSGDAAAAAEEDEDQSWLQLSIGGTRQVPAPSAPPPMYFYHHPALNIASSSSSSALMQLQMQAYHRQSQRMMGFRVVSPPPRRPHSGIWFSLQPSQNQTKQPFLPHISKSYLRIKDGRMTVGLLIKYLVNKLRLESESEIEITCRGQQLEPLMTLQHVRDNIWGPTLTLLQDSSTTTVTDHLMLLLYSRSP